MDFLNSATDYINNLLGKKLVDPQPPDQMLNKAKVADYPGYIKPQAPPPTVDEDALMSMINSAVKGVGSKVGSVIGSMIPASETTTMYRDPKHEHIIGKSEVDPTMPTHRPLQPPTLEQEPIVDMGPPAKPGEIDFSKYKNSLNWTPPPVPESIAQHFKKVFGKDANLGALLAVTENAKFNPKADHVNKNPDGTTSLDRGIMQINSDSFNGLMKRRKPELDALGIKSYDDMYDPQKNIQVGKMIYDEGGPGRWYGWQNHGYDLMNGQYTVPWKLQQLAQGK